MLLAEGMTVKLLLLPDDDDPDSFARKHTATEFQEYLQAHQVDFIRFKTNLLQEEAQNDPIKLSRLVNNIVDSLAVIPDDIARTFYIKETSQMLTLEERLITSAVGKVRTRLQDERKKEREREAAREQTDSDSIPKDSPDSPPEPVREGGESVRGNSLGGESSGADSDKILRQEQLLIQMVVRYGERVMCNVENENGEEQPLTVVEFVQYSLAEDHLELRHPLHQQILTEALLHEHEEGFRCDRYFENHPELAIAELSTELAHDPEALSKIHEKGIPVKPEEERLVELVPHLMADYKLAIVEEELHSIMQQMKDPAVLADRERSIELMQRYADTKQIQSQLSRQRGDRVIN
jgi:DNA primase